MKDDCASDVITGIVLF